VAVRALVASTKAKFDEVTATLQRGASPDAIPEAMASPVVQRLRDQHANTLRREAALSSQLGPRHPLMADARAQVESSRNQITTELQRVARQTEAEFQIATAREREISARIETLEKDVAGTATAQIRLRELEREADASREVLRTFLARAKETQEEQNLSKADARIITPAAIPPAPSSPNPLLVLALSGFAGLGATGLYALLRGVPAPIAPMPRASPLAPMAARRPVVQMAPDVLGQLPPLATRGRLTRTFSGTPGVRMTDVLTAITDGTRPEEIAFRDAMKTTAAAVRKSWTGPMGTQVVLAMSETRGIASSMTALGLAYVEAAAGRPTFLIDGASADPRLSTEFASDLNQERPCVLDSKEHLLEISSRDPQSGLMFLPIALANLDGLSEAQRLRLSMGVSRLAEDVDLIVIDGGAVSDSTGVAALAGQVTTLVVAGSQGTETDVRAVADAVRVPQAKLAGLVRVGS
jgi:Mrp family chromosome partitioning ATPase